MSGHGPTSLFAGFHATIQPSIDSPIVAIPETLELVLNRLSATKSATRRALVRVAHAASAVAERSRGGSRLCCASSWCAVRRVSFHVALVHGTISRALARNPAYMPVEGRGLSSRETQQVSRHSRLRSHMLLQFREKAPS
jgi:hypothetical protein